MHTDFDEMLALMDRVFCDLERKCGKPQPVQLSFGIAFRFKEKNIYQAVILKLAHAQSAVRAAQVLLDNGFVHEQAILHRIMHETVEDIMFLAFAVINNDFTDLHRKFLDAFWEEEIDQSGNLLDSKQNRPMVPRKKILSYLEKQIDCKQSHLPKFFKVARTIHKLYSGFVHGSSPQLMDMYGGHPPCCHTSGMLGTLRIEELTDDLRNCVFQVCKVHEIVAKAFGMEQCKSVLGEASNRFAQRHNLILRF